MSKLIKVKNLFLVVPYQFVWSMGLGFLYMIQSLLLYYFGTDPDYKILYEETLDWGNYPATSLAVCFSVIFIVIPIVHFLQYAIFKKRISIFI